VKPGANSSFEFVNGPKATIRTELIRTLADLQVLSVVQRAESGNEHSLLELIGQVSVANPPDELSPHCLLGSEPFQVITDPKISDFANEGVQVPTEIADVLETDVDIWKDLTAKSHAHDADCPSENACDSISDVLAAAAASQIYSHVLDLTLRDDVSLSANRTVGIDRCDHWATIACLAERQRFRIARIGECLGVLWSVVVADKCMDQARGGNLGRRKWSVWGLSLSLKYQ